MPPQVKEPIAERRPAPKAKDRVIIVPPIVAPPVVVNPPAERPKIQKPPTPEVDPEQAATNVAWMQHPIPPPKNLNCLPRVKRSWCRWESAGPFIFQHRPARFLPLAPAHRRRTPLLFSICAAKSRRVSFVGRRTCALRWPLARMENILPASAV